MKKGFTLVELSIVLVIIGLLIGGILAAQSMISTVKLQKTIRDIQQYDIVTANFKSKYKALPGDTNLLTPAGNNDGSLHTTSHDIWENFTEEKNFWLHLSYTGFMPEKTFTTTVSGSGLVSKGQTINVPALTYSDVAQIIPMGSQTGEDADPSHPTGVYVATENHFLISNKSEDQMIGGPFPGLPVFYPADAAAIDSKMDDGKPLAGYVKGSNNADCVLATFDADTDYNTSNNVIACSLSVLIGESLSIR